MFENKHYPAYGKRIKLLRDKGLVPCGDVIVTFDWKIGKVYTRIVISPDKPIKTLNFSYLAGLNVMIAHNFHDAFMLPDLVDEILRVKPKMLVTFNYMLAKQNFTGNSAFCLIHPARKMQ